MAFAAFFEEQAVVIAKAPPRKPCWSLAFWAIVEVEDDDSAAEVDTALTVKTHLKSHIPVGRESGAEADDCKDHSS